MLVTLHSTFVPTNTTANSFCRCWVKSLQGTVKETVYHMGEGRLVPEQENYFHPGELSYIEGR